MRRSAPLLDSRESAAALRRPLDSRKGPLPPTATRPQGLPSLSGFSFSDVPIFDRSACRASEPQQLEDFPHRQTVERSLGVPILGRALFDPEGCKRHGVVAYTQNGVSHFAAPSPSLMVAAHEATHQAQHLGLTRDAHLGAERHAETVAKITAGRGSAQALVGSFGAPVSTGLHFYTESNDETENFTPAEPRPITHQVTVNTTLLKPAKNMIDSYIQTADSIYRPYGICIKQGAHLSVEKPDTRGILGKNLALNEAKEPGTLHAEESKLFELNRTPGQVTAYFVPESGRKSLRGQSYEEQGAIIINTAHCEPSTLAHELGHMFIHSKEGQEDHVTSPKIEALVSAAVKEGRIRKKYAEADLHKLFSSDPNAPTDAKAQQNLMAPGLYRIPKGPHSNQLTRVQLKAILSSPYLKRV